MTSIQYPVTSIACDLLCAILRRLPVEVILRDDEISDGVAGGMERSTGFDVGGAASTLLLMNQW